MKLNQNKKNEILQLDNCSKNLLLWIQLQALQEDKIECTYSLYCKDVKVSLNTFKKSLGGLLDSRILYATSSKGWYRLNEDFIADSDHNGLEDFNQNGNCYGGIRLLKDIKPKVLTNEETELFIYQWEKENNKPFTFCSLDKNNTFEIKAESFEDIKKDLLK